LCVNWYATLKPRQRDLVIIDGRPRHPPDTYNDAPGYPALPSGVREAPATQRSPHREIVEERRDLYNGSRTMGCTCAAPSTKRAGNSRFISQPEPAMKNAAAPGDARDAERPRTWRHVQLLSTQYLNNLVEQCPSESEPGIQAIRRSVGNGFWNRAGRENQEGAAQDWQTRRVQRHDDGTLGRGTCSLTSIRRPEFAHEPAPPCRTNTTTRRFSLLLLCR
jgi:hypothetical protein